MKRKREKQERIVLKEAKRSKAKELFVVALYKPDCVRGKWGGGIPL